VSPQTSRVPVHRITCTQAPPGGAGGLRLPWSGDASTIVTRSGRSSGHPTSWAACSPLCAHPLGVRRGGNRGASPGRPASPTSAGLIARRLARQAQRGRPV